MSANLDLVRSIYADWQRGDFSSTEWAHPEIEFVSARGLDPGSWTGLAGMREGERGLLDAYEGFRTRAEEFRELDHERVLVLSHQSGRGKRSGLELEQLGGAKGADLFHVRNGKVTKLVIYGDRARARRPRPHAGGWPSGLVTASALAKQARGQRSRALAQWTTCVCLARSWARAARRLLASSKQQSRPRREHQLGARAPGVRLLQSCSPAVADIMGARRACTVEMISSMSIPCR